MAREWLVLPTSHFYDDFYCFHWESVASSALSHMHEFFHLLGFRFDHEKGKLPNLCFPLLGVTLDSTEQLPSAILMARPQPERVLNILRRLHTIQETGKLSPAAAGRLCGQLEFICSTLFGRVGRAALNPFRKHSQAPQRRFQVPDDVRFSARLLISLLVSASPRTVQICRDPRPPVLIYSDGAGHDEEELIDAIDPAGRPAGCQYSVGATLYDPLTDTREFIFSWVSPELVAGWSDSIQHISRVELVAVPWALQTWHRKVQDRHIIWFCDNTAATAGLINCLLYTSPSPRDGLLSRMPSSA